MAKDDYDKCTRAYRESAAFKRASFHPPDEIWSMFADTDGFVDVVHIFRALVDSLSIDQELYGLEFFQILRSKLTTWKCQSLWDLLNARLKCKEYKHENAPVGKNIKCLVIGAGPIGLRTAIEMLMLGCRTVVVEKRKDFSRNNVLHLWPFLIHDFRTLGAKKFYGKFGSGCIDHINIKTLQTLLLKVALVLGVEIYSGVEFQEILEPTGDHGWRATFNPPNHTGLSKCDFDIIVGADGKRNVLPGFKQQELRGSLAIGITCNFINNNTPEETNCKEISGISYQFKPAFFDEMKAKHGVELENIVYYKDETHYFVMTARKNSLLNTGVLLKDYTDPALLCQSSNINTNILVDYTCKAVRYSTTLTKLEFKKLSNGKPDIALFDFTSLKKADSASRILERKGRKLILALVGDSLIEPFWPTGSGCGRGVLSALDVAWMVRQFALNYPPLVMLRDRENVYKLLSASTHDNTQKNHSLYTIDPKTRYQSLDVKKVTNLENLTSLYDTDDLSADMTLSSPLPQKRYVLKKKTAVERRKSGGSGALRPSGKLVAGKTKRKLERQESKREEKKLSIKDAKNFFEEHNKKMSFEPDRPRRAPRPSEEFSGLEEIHEHIDESDDDILVDDEEPASKRKSETESLRHSNSKELLNTSKGKVKRATSKDLSKKNLKSLKRTQSKDGDLSGPSKDETPGATSGVKKKVFQAKGGGLKSKKAEVRKSSESTTASSDKKSSVKRKSRKSRKSTGGGGSASEIEASREEPVDVIQPVDAKTFFTKWLEALIPRLFNKATRSPPHETYEHPLDVCIQTSVISVLGISLLMDCNKPQQRRRTTELKLKEIIANSNGKTVETKAKSETSDELSKISRGRVRDSMAKWQKLEQETEQNHDYCEFINRKQESTVASSSEKDGVLLVKQINADFTPKDVIDIEEQLIADEEEERKRSRLAKVTIFIINKFLLLLLFIAMLAGLIVIAVHFILVS